MLSRLSVKKPMTVFVCVMLVLILGVMSFINMTTDLLPNMDLPYAIAYTTYIGASPEQVEQSVTKPPALIRSPTPCPRPPAARCS